MKKIFTLVAGLALAGSISVNAEIVNIYVEDYDENNIANYSESEISLDEEGNIVLSDFMYSETALKFKFEAPAVEEWGVLTITNDLDSEDTYPYILDEKGDYPTYWLWNYKDNGDWTPINYPYFYNTGGYPAVYRYDMNDPENTEEYYASICLNGYNEDNSKFGWIYVNFWFNIPVPDAVSSVETSNNAPVEFYNLAGQRVDNPQGGLFIRKQGAKATKVMVK